MRERGVAASLGFDPRPDSERGLSLALGQRQLEARLGDGFAVFGDRFTTTPEAGLALSDGHREVSLGGRLGLARSGPVSMALGLRATRCEAANDDDGGPAHARTLRGAVRW